MKRKSITINNFIEKLNDLCKSKSIPSKTGRVSYSSFKIEMNTISFKRDNVNTIWKIDIDKLYRAYTELDYIDTKNIRPYVNNANQGLKITKRNVAANFPNT